MGQSLSQVYLHIVFSTKYRRPLIDDKIEGRLYDYLGGICNRLDCQSLQIGGHLNHVHILCKMSKQITQAKLLETVKKQSSKWIKTCGDKYYDFYWQVGYAVFSVNPRQISVVCNYIKNQKNHHKTIDFKDELRALLKKYNVEYDERYIWD